MLSKYQHLGVPLTEEETKQIHGGAVFHIKTRWRCLTDPTIGWWDYICYNGQPPCPYYCEPAGQCVAGDYQNCVM